MVAVKDHRSPLEVLFPKVRARMFELLFGPTGREHYVRELALRSHLALHTVQDELRKLKAVGLVISRAKGLHRYYQANTGHPVFPAIRQIIALSNRLPRARAADLRRPPGKTLSKRNRKARPARLRMPYEPINWGLAKKP
jgi:predicted transcriptional regulator